MFEVVALLFDRSFASSVVNSTLGQNIFTVPFVRRPMALFSNWTTIRVLWLLADFRVHSSLIGVVGCGTGQAGDPVR